MMWYCEILVHEFWALPVTRALALGRAAESPWDSTAREGSRNPSSHQYKIKACLQCDSLNTAPGSLPE